MKELHTKKFHLYPDGRLEVYYHRLATRLNKRLKQYEDGKYIFQPGEEGLFKIGQIEYSEILSHFLAPKSTFNPPLIPKQES